jgi:carbon monoxide dehydrogenase subunit G
VRLAVPCGRDRQLRRRGDPLGQGDAHVVSADRRGTGHAGFIKGTSDIALRADGETTIVDVKAGVHAGGAIARVGQRLLGSVSQMMLEPLLACLTAKV